jgi:hypothetical protein
MKEYGVTDGINYFNDAIRDSLLCCQIVGKIMCAENRVNLENELAAIMNQLPNAVEIMVSKLSSITTEQQLRILVDYLKKELV